VHTFLDNVTWLYRAWKNAKETTMRKTICILSVVLLLGLGLSTFARQGQNAPPVVPKDSTKIASLLFREDFKVPKEHEVQFTPDLLTNPNLELKKYGPGAKPGNADQSGLLISIEGDPVTGKMQTLVWTGVVQGSWAVMFKDKNNYLDLRNTARVHWRTRPRAFKELRLVVKLADGTMLASDRAEPVSTYSHESEVFFSDILLWRTVNPETMAEAKPKPGAGQWTFNPDLSKVDEIGFTDLGAGAGHGAVGGNVAVDWIEVYGDPVKRTAAQSSAR
jgi:hypothetical protein